MLDELMAGALAGCFAQAEPRRQARKYVTGLISELPPVRKFAVTHLGDPAGAVLVLDEPGQEKAPSTPPG
jgi:hypothetical protein